LTSKSSDEKKLHERLADQSPGIVILRLGEKLKDPDWLKQQLKK
jgi:hypothetical protein